VPLGIRAEVCAKRGTLRLLEAPVLKQPARRLQWLDA
jgi:hypothetical protein